MNYQLSKKAVRRHHYQRLKEKRIKENYWGYDKNDKSLGICINTSKTCSCRIPTSRDKLCGNQRKYFAKETRQERKIKI